ncbi:hypothetical protein UY3_14524 [Chelonia mydas]|uniref:Uncharacterized protein n=1 Tax=Chelonia mydas TaxID=8469 RepID=M7BJH5_CHEMY|nr:hypothetical protein UY3_14524 [Chelonia mydas]
MWGKWKARAPLLQFDAEAPPEDQEGGHRCRAFRFAHSSEEPLDSSINPAPEGTLLTATEPVEAMASAMRLGPEPPGVPLIGVEQSTSSLGRGPTEDSPPPDAVAAKPTIEPAPGIAESHLPSTSCDMIAAPGPFSNG